MRTIVLTAFLGLLVAGTGSCDDSKVQRPKLPDNKMKEKAVDAQGVPKGHEIITLGAGCFWCVEAVYQQLEGIHSARSGYMGGWVENPTYEQICQKNTGHVEVVQVVYDPKKIPTSDVLAWFWELHDPTTKDRQGADVGPQYRSVIFYHDAEQKKVAEASMKAAQPHFKAPIVTEIRESKKFYIAEGYHQDFYFQNPSNGYCRAVIQPKLLKLKLKTK